MERACSHSSPVTAELLSNPHSSLLLRSEFNRMAFQCKKCYKMTEESRTHLAIRDGADHNLARPALLRRLRNPCSLIESNNSGGSTGVAHICDSISSLSNEGFMEKDTDCALTPSAFESVVFDEPMLRTDNVISMSNEAVGLSSNLRLRR